MIDPERVLSGESGIVEGRRTARAWRRARPRRRRGRLDARSSRRASAAAVRDAPPAAGARARDLRPRRRGERWRASVARAAPQPPPRDASRSARSARRRPALAGRHPSRGARRAGQVREPERAAGDSARGRRRLGVRARRRRRGCRATSSTAFCCARSASASSSRSPRIATRAMPPGRSSRRARWSVARRTRLVEIGPVTAFHRSVAGELLPFPPLRMGWGLDSHWGGLALERGWRLGVVDATPVRHDSRAHGQRLRPRRRCGGAAALPGRPAPHRAGHRARGRGAVSLPVGARDGPTEKRDGPVTKVCDRRRRGSPAPLATRVGFCSRRRLPIRRRHRPPAMTFAARTTTTLVAVLAAMAAAVSPRSPALASAIERDPGLQRGRRAERQVLGSPSSSGRWTSFPRTSTSTRTAAL